MKKAYQEYYFELIDSTDDYFPQNSLKQINEGGNIFFVS